MRNLAMAAILCVLLSGCMTAAEREAAIERRDDDACQSYGAEPGSQAYFQCRMMKDQQRQANNTALAAAILSRPQPQPYYLPMPSH